MKTADINVGEFYAYRSHSAATPMRVEVLDKGVKRTEGLYSWEKRTVKNGITVKMPNGRTTVVTSRQIGPTWAEQDAVNQHEAALRRLRDEARRATQTRRASTAKRLSDFLAGYGYDTVEEFVSRRDVDALKAAGFEVVDDEPRFSTSVMSALPNLSEFMASGAVGESVIETLLVEVESR